MPNNGQTKRICLWCNKIFQPKTHWKGKKRLERTLSNFCSFSHRSYYQWRKGARRKSQKRMKITKDELEDRIKNKLQTIGQIAKELNVSYDTVHRRALELGLDRKWSHTQGARVWVARNRITFVIQVAPEVAEIIKNEIKHIISLEPSTIVRVFHPNETWRDLRSELSGEVDYKIQRERFETLQRIAVADSS